MAGWICHDRGSDYLFQSSASRRKRGLIISQTRDEIWIIVGEDEHAYEEYIRNAPLRAGMSTTNAPPSRHTALASNFEEHYQSGEGRGQPLPRLSVEPFLGKFPIRAGA
ncbi:hypothetical protein P885DRAFT_63801 [Corynascus similis CBS 632.67]